MGEATRFSTNTKTMSEAKPTIKLPRTSGCLQPKFADSTNPNTIPPSPTVANADPSQSVFCGVELRDSGMCQREMAMTAAAIGTLIKKTQCQEACSINQPPSTGPRAVVIAVNPDQVPMARPRDFSSKEALIIARLLGTRNAAPIPWKERAMINCEMLEESPQPTEAAANSPVPNKKTERRPKESPIAPPIKSSAARNNP